MDEITLLEVGYYIDHNIRLNQEQNKLKGY